ncbi:germin-like protein subfamily 1 member 17 [Tripterygium wilfordii]|uniref:germin-like protein subfamily 1 member 17 n=1 Tax=Tripterygium wilfordii TaxID=458696 RepID=UPI0018F855EB|nr:germin-like protein subfamily 1 member 17 [Tripterygium wilfordii]
MDETDPRFSNFQSVRFPFIDLGGASPLLVPFLLLALASPLVSAFSAFDPSPLQDFCVAIDDPRMLKVLQGPEARQCKRFLKSGLNISGDVSNAIGSNVTAVTVNELPGLNTLGVALVRIDYAPYGGLNPPHTHPRNTEIRVVLEGTLYVGFVTSNVDGNRLFTKILNTEDVFVFPIGIIHFQLNIGKTAAVAFAGLSSQNFGVITIANAVFGLDPPINPDVLTKAFQLDKNIVEYLQKMF